MPGSSRYSASPTGGRRRDRRRRRLAGPARDEAAGRRRTSDRRRTRRPLTSSWTCDGPPPSVGVAGGFGASGWGGPAEGAVGELIDLPARVLFHPVVVSALRTLAARTDTAVELGKHPRVLIHHPRASPRWRVAAASLKRRDMVRVARCMASEVTARRVLATRLREDNRPYGRRCFAIALGGI